MRRLLLCAIAAVAFVSFVDADPPSQADRPARRTAPSMSNVMDQRVPNVELSGVALDDVFEFMRDTAGLNLYVNWPALEAAGIDRSVPIQLKLRNIKLGKVMDLALNQAAAGGAALTWYVSDNIVYVTTKALADQDMVTVIYPVQDLLVEVPNFKAPTFTPSSGGEGGGSGNVFETSNNDVQQDNDSAVARGEKLVELVMMVVEPDIWIENGGFARIRYFSGTLIVTAPRSVQKLIGK
jgi:hypothetical protein